MRLSVQCKWECVCSSEVAIDCVRIQTLSPVSQPEQWVSVVRDKMRGMEEVIRVTHYLQVKLILHAHTPTFRKQKLKSLWPQYSMSGHWTCCGCSDEGRVLSGWAIRAEISHNTALIKGQVDVAGWTNRAIVKGGKSVVVSSAHDASCRGFIV